MAKPASKISKKFTKKISARLGKAPAAEPEEEVTKVAPVAPAEPTPPVDEEPADYEDFEDDASEPQAQEDGREESEEAADEEDTTAGEEKPTEEGPVPGGMGKRIGAFLIDSVVTSLLLGAICAGYLMFFAGDTISQAVRGGALKEGVAVVATAETTGADTVAATSEGQPAGTGAAVVDHNVQKAKHAGGDLAESNAVFVSMTMLSLIPVMLTAFFSYYFVLEWLLAGTVGKLVCGLRIADKTSHKCRCSQALIRNLVKTILGGISMLVAFFTAKKQALHDLAAGTYVIAKADLIVPQTSSRKTGKAVKGTRISGRHKANAGEDAQDDRTPAAGIRKSERSSSPAPKTGLPLKKPGLPIGSGKKLGLPMKKVGKKIMMKKKP